LAPSASTVSPGAGGVASLILLWPCSAKTPATAAHATVTISAASQNAIPVQDADDRRGQRAERQEPGDAQHPGTRAGALALLGDLRAGERRLLAHQRRRLLREALEEITDGLLAQLLWWAAWSAGFAGSPLPRSRNWSPTASRSLPCALTVLPASAER
jgi:hypothetical protein